MASDPTNVTTHELDGMSYLEYCTGASPTTADLPCVLLLHWMGSGPQAMLPICAGYPQPARFLLPFGPLPLGDAYTWFPLDFYDQPLAEQGATIQAIADRLASFLRAVSQQTPYRGKAAVSWRSITRIRSVWRCRWLAVWCRSFAQLMRFPRSSARRSGCFMALMISSCRSRWRRRRSAGFSSRASTRILRAIPA